MADEGDFQPEIKFRWCRTIRCRAQVVQLVLTSITGTQVKLNWKADLGWYESDPTPIPCGFHTGFILVRERVRDFVKNTLETRESDYKVDPFHVVPHKFAVELFLESDEATSFWSEVPELRLRYLSSDHLEKLGTGSFEELSTTNEHGKGFPNRKWGSSTCLHTQADRLWRETSSLGYPRTYQEHKDTCVKGKSHGQLSELTIGELYNQSKGSSSSPNLSRAFQVAVDLSRASSKYLVGVSSTSSGVFLGFEDGSGPPSPENGNCTHTDSAYAAEGETSQESEPGEGARRRKKLQHLSRGKSLQIDDLVGDESWRPKRRRGRLGLSSAPSSSFEDLLGSVSADRRAAIKTEINLMRFETIKREKLVKEILQGSDSDFEDEEAPCEASNPDLQGPYQCVITFESRSASMDDVGSPRALEDVLVSLTSNDSQPEASQPQPLPRTVLQPDLLSDESAFITSEHEDKIPTPKPRTLTPVNVEDKKNETFCVTEGEKTTGDDSGEKLEKPEPSDEQAIKDEYDTEEQDDPFDIFFGSSGADSSGYEEQRREDACGVQEKEKLQSHDQILSLDEEAASVDQKEGEALGQEKEDKSVEQEKEDKSVEQEKEIEPSKGEEEEEEEEFIDQEEEECAVEESVGRSVDQDEEIYGTGDLLEVSDPLVRISDTEDDNFQYDSLKHDGNENLPIDLRNIDSEESLDIPVPRPGGGGFLKIEDKGEERTDSRTDDDEESEGGGADEVGGCVYEVEGAEAAYSSVDGEVPTDSVTLVPLDSYKGTVREVKSIEMIQEIGPTNKEIQETFEIVREKPIVEILKVHVTDVDDDTVQEVEYVGNEETDRSETEAVLYVTDVSRKRSVESDSEKLIIEEDGVETRTREQRALTGRTDDQLKDLYSGEKFKEHSKSNNDYDEPCEMDKEHTEPSDTGESFNRFSKNGHHVSDFTRHDNFRDKIHFDDDYRDPRLSDAESRKPRIVVGNDNRGLRRMFSDSDAKKIEFQTTGINTIVRDDQNSENHRPFIRPLKLSDTGTQTSLIRQISRTTSIDLQKLSDTDSSSEQYSTKYSRTPLRNRTNGQAESFTPLPDRLSGPWSQRHSASTSNARSSASTSPYSKPDLTLLQRNLYNLVQGSETTQVLQNSAHLQRLRGQQNAHIPRYQGAPTNVERRRTTSRPSTPDLPLSEHSSPKRQYHYHQSSDHNHYHQARSHYSPVHHKPQSAHYSPSYQYKYPLLSSSVITPSSPSRTTYVSSFTSGRINGLYSGSVTDLTRTPQKTKYDYITSTPKSGASGVRPASSLPDLRQPTTTSSSLPRQPSRVSPTYEYLPQGPRHAQSASDIMVGGYGSKGKRVSWREWRIADESDSGDSTDSLIDEAERLATTRIDIESEWDDRYRRRYRSRRRTRSHQEFSTWRDDSEAARRYPSNRPYLPYRGDQLSPGQQVKVLAPGGGVAVARVLTNQRSALLGNKSHFYPSHGVISPASVTVILLTEPNRLQGTVVTIPLEKVLLAWPRV